MKIFAKDPELIPVRKHPTDAGLDLKADKFYWIYEDRVTKIHTGVHLEIPKGYVGLIFPRSGFSVDSGAKLANTVGVIDSDYRGEIICALRLSYFTEKPWVVEKGERIAQLVIVPILTPELEVVNSVEDLSKTERGSGGFGHTGKL